jgi:NADP-dependent 3-hydroxy acid dehydrogenase YdfG
MSRVVAITGVCSEAAVATAHEFARRGDTLALMSRKPDAVDRGVALVERLGGRALGLVLDTTDPDAVEAAVARVEDELGPVEVWVNTADDPGERPFDQLDPGELRRVTELCYLGHVHATMTVLERMQDRGRGTIVHVASALAARGSAGRAALSGAEAALRGFHEAVSDELRAERSSVRVALVQRSPGGTAVAAARAVVHEAGAERRAALQRGAGAVVGGAAVAAGTAAVVRLRRGRRAR